MFVLWPIRPGFSPPNINSFLTFAPLPVPHQRFQCFDCWLVVLGFNATLTAKVISWRSVTHIHVFPGFLTPILTQLFFPKPPTTFLTCFCRDTTVYRSTIVRGERRKFARKKSRLNRGSNSQPPGHEADKLTTEPPGRGSNALIMYL